MIFACSWVIHGEFLPSRLPRDKSDTKKLVQFGLHKPILTRRSLQSLAILTLSTFNDKSKTCIVSEFCGKILCEPLTSLQRYVVESATNEILMDDQEKIVKAFPRPSSLSPPVLYPNEKKLPQKDYYSEKLARQNVVETEAELNNTDCSLFKELIPNRSINIISSLESTKTPALFDPGTTDFIISTNMAKLLKIKLNSTPIHVQYADFQSDAFRAKEYVIFKFGDRSVKTKPLVMNCSRQVIIGQEELKGLNVSFHYNKHGVEINSIISKCSIVEDIKSQHSSIMSSHRSDIGTCKNYAPRLQFIKEDLLSNPRHDPNPKLLNTLREEYLKMVEFRHIIPVSASNKMPKYICNIVPVKKKNDHLRITCDLQKVNEILAPLHYSSPKLCPYLMHFSGYHFISKLDLLSAYSQMTYHPDVQQIIGDRFNNNIFLIPRLTMEKKIPVPSSKLCFTRLSKILPPLHIKTTPGYSHLKPINNTSRRCSKCVMLSNITASKSTLVNANSLRLKWRYWDIKSLALEHVSLRSLSKPFQSFQHHTTSINLESLEVYSLS
uniref:Reverse transcriptase domain-containing protein n=1 Tax=Strongyloides papillosus TaxID=174720 RepID=A0A0N5B246_STREA